jgi:hypothetical protein
MEQGVRFALALVEFNDETERRHQKLIELMSARSGSLNTGSSVSLLQLIPAVMA